MPVTIPDLSAVEAGSEIDILIPQEGIRYAGTVEKLQISRSGSRSVIGMFDVDGTGYRFVFTVGNQYTFGTLHTPAGRYQLESIDGSGRIVSVNEINATRDFSKPDYVLPTTNRDNNR